MNLKNSPTLKSSKIKVGITLGDPSGIGSAVILKALQEVYSLAQFYVIGDNWVLNKSGLGGFLQERVNFIDLNNITRKNFKVGKVCPEYGKASVEYLQTSLELIDNGTIDCIVTAPVSKEAINLAGYKYSGQTEYFAQKTNSQNTVMMLLNDKLRFSLLTRHIPLKDVALKLNRKMIRDNIFLTKAALKKLFALKKPKLIVCGLNPHASDNGLIGKEENMIIRPAVKSFDNVYGPISADIAIAKLMLKEYDCAVAMYHDQALIALKLTGSDKGVNITLGLPFVRTSPLHGTAFDIAKFPRLANPSSMIQAIKVAIECTQNQREV